MHDLAGKADLAGVRRQRAAQSLDQRRLAGAVVANHRENLAGIEIEVGMVERDDTPEPLHQAARLQDRFGGHFETLRIH